MKKTNLLKSDYVLIVLGIFFALLAINLHGSDSIIVLVWTSIIGMIVFLVGRVLWRGLQRAENNGRIDKIFDSLKKMFYKAVAVVLPLYFALLTLWFGFKVLLSCLTWLKNDYWIFYDYQPACSALGFSCYPNTSFVKIDQLLVWIYSFDVTVFLFASGIAVVAILFWLHETDKSL